MNDVIPKLGETALIIASKAGHADAIHELIKNGADMNARDFLKATALMHAVLKQHDQCIKILIQDWNGVDINVPNREGLSALVMVAGSGNVENIRRLIQIGADVNYVNKGGLTALMHCAHLGKKDAVSVLIEAGASVNATDLGGHTAVAYATKQNHLGCVKLLLKAGTNLTELNDLGSGALVGAALADSTRCVKLLIQAGADVNGKSNLECTALMIAASKENKANIKLLLKARACVNVPYSFRNLHFENVLEMYIANSIFRRNLSEYIAKLLMVAGERVPTTDLEVRDLHGSIAGQVAVPDYLRQRNDSLLAWCRTATRQHLLDLTPVNLFVRIPQLIPWLPSVLIDYLLFDMISVMLPMETASVLMTTRMVTMTQIILILK